MMKVAPFEIEVLRELTAKLVPIQLLERVIQEGEFVSCEHTGCGYFLTLRHSELPADRRVFTDVVVFGEHAGVQIGFVVFIEANELTLECHAYGPAHLPDTIRESGITLTSVTKVTPPTFGLL